MRKAFLHAIEKAFGCLLRRATGQCSKCVLLPEYVGTDRKAVSGVFREATGM